MFDLGFRPPIVQSGPRVRQRGPASGPRRTRVEQARTRAAPPPSAPCPPPVPGAVPAQPPSVPQVPPQARGGHPHAPAAPAPVRVRRHSVRGQILGALRAALVDGELVPGEVYSAPALGERFGVSATPVREAMQRLAAEGAVEVVPNRGFRIAARSPRERAELAEVRALVEIPVVLRLARTLPADRWEGLRPLAEATVRAAAEGDHTRYADADRAFHRALLAPARNGQLLAVAEGLHRQAQWPLPAAPALAADAAQHAALVDALLAGDPASVAMLLDTHFAPPPP
ncbi:GntR family transcriptional regulator [Streptomyces sp. NPDC000594]|uniref:GntR family transcriptional regulator n=1 Tax=Streptomyces sp. NPDC000594 TaxID=3154261 RepID=UPI003324730F